jgi:hypothetical protein
VPKAIEAMWKIESTGLIAAIARVTHDFGSAEEPSQDTLVAALELWPEQGTSSPPDRPQIHFHRRVCEAVSLRILVECSATGVSDGRTYLPGFRTSLPRIVMAEARERSGCRLSKIGVRPWKTKQPLARAVLQHRRNRRVPTR